MSIQPAPVVLTGTRVYLEPLTMKHLDPLWEAGAFPSLWQWTPSQIASPGDMQDYIRRALAEQEKGSALPFVIRLVSDHSIVGSTRFGNITPEHRRAEIGWTWVTPRWQRTAVNTETKWLMLRHGFEQWQCQRIEFKTDARNTRSRNAILRIGAQEEGTLRQHMLLSGGHFRDTVYFSIVQDEWPRIDQHLRQMLASFETE